MTQKETYMSYKTEKKAALDFANEVRKDVGKAPVTRLQKGWPREDRYCPIARTIDQDGMASVGVGTAAYGTSDELSTQEANGKYEHAYEIPEGAQRFIVAFDGDKIPELVKDTVRLQNHDPERSS